VTSNTLLRSAKTITFLADHSADLLVTYQLTTGAALGNEALTYRRSVVPVWSPNESGGDFGINPFIGFLNPLAPNSTAWLEATLPGPGEVSFWWKLTTDHTVNYRVLIDGHGIPAADVIQGPALRNSTTDWTQMVFQVAGNGPHVVRWQCTDPGGGELGAYGGLSSLRFTPANGFSAWAAANGLPPAGFDPDGGYSGDPDGDGMPNFMEFALGTDPKSLTHPDRLSYSVQNGKLTITVPKPTAFTLYGVLFSAEASSDLLTWSEDDVEILTNSATTFTARDTRAASAQPRFLRLKVTAPGDF
jgi:hypothetical protein